MLLVAVCPLVVNERITLPYVENKNGTLYEMNEKQNRKDDKCLANTSISSVERFHFRVQMVLA